jgi:secernin
MTPDQDSPLTLSCDTLVVSNGPNGNLFAKNSDRPGIEPQPLLMVPAASHQPGSVVKCQYLEVPQVRETFEVLGSRPSWLWGFEHGVNEVGVAIGNEAVYTREPVADTGLLGMDIVRLALERAESALSAVNVITELIDSIGQGGLAVQGSDRKYHNSFLVADAQSIFIVESSDKNWVVKEAPDGAAISNHLTIEDDWSTSSAALTKTAFALGLWPDDTRVNFRAAFEDSSARIWSQARYLASCMMVQRTGPISVEAMMRHLRDHFEGGSVHIPDASVESARPRTICMHPGSSLSATSASMVVPLVPGGGKPTAWCSMATPCTSPFLPVKVGAKLPSPLTGSEPDGDSLWWQLHEVQQLSETDPLALTPAIQTTWAAVEATLIAAVCDRDGWSQRLLDELVVDVLSTAREIVDAAARDQTVAL